MTILRTLVLLAGLALLTTPSYSQPAPGPERAQKNPERPEHIRVEDNLLSVELNNATFGEVMAEIAQKAEFKALISKDIYKKKLTTNFTDMDMQRGIARLLSLIKQKTYFIYYTQEGSISRVEVHGLAPVEPVFRPIPPALRPPPLPLPPRLPSPSVADPFSPEAFEEMMDEPVEAPYIPPVREPVYIPPPGR